MDNSYPVITCRQIFFKQYSRRRSESQSSPFCRPYLSVSVPCKEGFFLFIAIYLVCGADIKIMIPCFYKFFQGADDRRSGVDRDPGARLEVPSGFSVHTRATGFGDVSFDAWERLIIFIRQRFLSFHFLTSRPGDDTILPIGREILSAYNKPVCDL